jgi:hypothetical protein
MTIVQLNTLYSMCSPIILDLPSIVLPLPWNNFYTMILHCITLLFNFSVWMLLVFLKLLEMKFQITSWRCSLSIFSFKATLRLWFLFNQILTLTLVYIFIISQATISSNFAFIGLYWLSEMSCFVIRLLVISFSILSITWCLLFFWIDIKGHILLNFKPL